MKLYEFVNSSFSDIYPQRRISCVNPKYWYTQGRVVIVRCGKCLSCLRKQKSDWALRIMLEAQDHLDNQFITLTYNDENCPFKLVKKHLQDFIKLLRSSLDYKIRYFASGEYGDRTHRPHYHLIIFGLQNKDVYFVAECWKKGFVTVEPVNNARCQYVAGYTIAKLEQGTFSVMSRRPGLGFNFLFNNYKRIYDKGFLAINGFKYPIPRAFFRKLKELDEDFYNQILSDYESQEPVSDMTAFLHKLEYNNLDFIKKRSLKNHEL